MYLIGRLIIWGHDLCGHNKLFENGKSSDLTFQVAGQQIVDRKSMPYKSEIIRKKKKKEKEDLSDCCTGPLNQSVGNSREFQGGEEAQNGCK